MDTPVDDATLVEVLRACCTVAVVGLGNVPDKPLFETAQFLLDEGVCVVPVHPRAERVFEQPAYRRIGEVPESLGVDLVLIGTRPQVAAEVLDEIVADGRFRRAWLEPGSDEPQAIQRARAAGVAVVAGRSIVAEFKRHLDEV